jgi:hypothetical protein
MKQNHKKIKIYSEAFCSLVTNFREFQTTKIMLNDFVVLMKKDSTINAFLQSKSIDKSQQHDPNEDELKTRHLCNIN